MRKLLIETFEKPTEIDCYGTIVWRNEDDEIHRENDMPAVVWADGSKFW